MEFKKWLLRENDTRTGAKLGLYPSISDSLGQLPPLAITPKSADFITYYGIQYDKNPLKFSSPGIVVGKDTARGDKKVAIWKFPN